MIKKLLIIIVTVIAIVGCNGGGGNGDNPSPAPSPTSVLTPLNITIQSESKNLVTNNHTIDVRQFGIDPVINITYTNNQIFPINLQVANSWFIESNGMNGCGELGVQRNCPKINVIYGYGKYINECDSYVSHNNLLQPGESCIQSLRIINGWNFTSSELLNFGGYAAGYYYLPEGWSKGGFYESLPLTLQIGITRNIGSIGTYDVNNRMLTNDGTYFYRTITNTNGVLGKYKVTYDDNNRTATLNTVPESTIAKPYAGNNTSLVGIANNGNPIGNSNDTTNYLQNYINGINFAYGTPAVAAGYDDMLVGLDGNNYAVNGQSTLAGTFNGNNIAQFNSNNSTYSAVLPLIMSSLVQVTQEGNIVTANGNQLSCYMKNQSYAKVPMNLNTPNWAGPIIGTLYQLGNRIYVSTDGMWVAINGSNCSLDWSDIRSFSVNGDYYGASNYQIFTKNSRVLYGIWDDGSVLYYPYSY
ncbi:MAG: hypothetical protein EKK54_04310 [Neisseriaceae bacterium]|nr:MAG: hypothetical protein EKK54_04310 [Neisseriaceae bacterium]